jgi:hypothetical protein
LELNFNTFREGTGESIKKVLIENRTLRQLGIITELFFYDEGVLFC